MDGKANRLLLKMNRSSGVHDSDALGNEVRYTPDQMKRITTSGGILRKNST